MSLIHCLQMCYHLTHPRYFFSLSFLVSHVGESHIGQTEVVLILSVLILAVCPPPDFIHKSKFKAQSLIRPPPAQCLQ